MEEVLSSSEQSSQSGGTRLLTGATIPPNPIQDIDQLIEAVTRKGDHHIDRPCMACLDGNYVAKDIDNKKILELELSRKNDRNGN